VMEKHHIIYIVMAAILQSLLLLHPVT